MRSIGLRAGWVLKSQIFLGLFRRSPRAVRLYGLGVGFVFWKGEEALSAEEFKNRLYAGADIAVAGSLRNLNGGDRARLKAELSEMLDLSLRAVPNDVNTHCLPEHDRFMDCIGTSQH